MNYLLSKVQTFPGGKRAGRQKGREAKGPGGKRAGRQKGREAKGPWYSLHLEGWVAGARIGN